MKTKRFPHLLVLTVAVIFACNMPPQTPAPSPTPPPLILPILIGATAPPACQPPPPSFDNLYSFCASAPNVGGMTAVYYPADGPGGAYLFNDPNNPGNNINNPKITCTDDSKNVPPLNSLSPALSAAITQSGGTYGKVICSGPVNASFSLNVCDSCGFTPDILQQITANIDSISCSIGYVKDANGNCQPSDPTQAYLPCPLGDYWKDGHKFCTNIATDQDATDVCPAGTQTYMPDRHYCLPFSLPVAYRCFPNGPSSQLGDCPVPPTKSATCQQQTCSSGVWSNTLCQCVVSP